MERSSHSTGHNERTGVTTRGIRTKPNQPVHSKRLSTSPDPQPTAPTDSHASRPVPQSWRLPPPWPIPWGTTHSSHEQGTPRSVSLREQAQNPIRTTTAPVREDRRPWVAAAAHSPLPYPLRCLPPPTLLAYVSRGGPSQRTHPAVSAARYDPGCRGACHHRQTAPAVAPWRRRPTAHTRRRPCAPTHSPRGQSPQCQAVGRMQT